MSPRTRRKRRLNKKNHAMKNISPSLNNNLTESTKNEEILDATNEICKTEKKESVKSKTEKEKGQNISHNTGRSDIKQEPTHTDEPKLTKEIHNKTNKTSKTTERKESVIKPKMEKEKRQNNSDNTAKSDIKQEPTNTDKKSKIAILGEVIDLMESESDQNEFTTILQNVLEVSDSEKSMKSTKIEILDLFLENLKNCSKEDFGLIAGKCFDFMSPKALLRIVTKKNDIIEEMGQLGSGGFGVVRKGIFCPVGGTKTSVAIKVALYDKEDFLKNEAKIMSQLDHPNIIKILAYQTKPVKLIMEYMEFGNLTEFLSKVTVPLGRLYLMMLDILKGMEYMSGKDFIHRDLSTRNIFVNSQLLCKIGDFGMSCYAGYTNGIYSQERGCLQGPNVAPESRITQNFTTKSDVWSMGDLILDMFFLNRVSGLSDFYNFKRQQNIWHIMGITDMQPNNCPDDLYDYIINNIMNSDPNKRPSFTKIIKFIVLTKN